MREKERVEAMAARSKKERSNDGKLDKEREATAIKSAARSKCLVEIDVVRSSPSGWVGGHSGLINSFVGGLGWFEQFMGGSLWSNGER